MRLRYSLEEQERAVSVLKEALNQQRRAAESSEKKMSGELEERLEQQKQEYESTVRRHQSFVDQLIEDKRGLSERCDLLHLDLKNMERRSQESLRSAEQRHAAELRRVKALNETSSKIRQEKWVDEKTRRIKEQTVRNLEPEIQRLMARHTAELSDLEGHRDRQLLQQESHSLNPFNRIIFLFLPDCHRRSHRSGIYISDMCNTSASSGNCGRKRCTKLCRRRKRLWPRGNTENTEHKTKNYM